MTTKQKYLTAQSLRIALEDRLNRMSRDKNIDIMRLRRHVAFDRLLARLFSGHTKDLIVKGGYALELWINNARTTKDIDISFQGNLGGVWTGERSSDPKALQDFLQNLVSLDTKDFFEFIIGNAVLDLDNAPYGGYRFPVEARMAGRILKHPTPAAQKRGRPVGLLRVLDSRAIVHAGNVGQSIPPQQKKNNRCL
jgi:hypothetical protein